MGIQGTSNCRAAICVPAIAAALIALAAPAHAADMPGTTTATVVRPNSLVKTDDLDFGTIISGATGGTVSLDAITGARTRTGGATLVGNDAQRAQFQGTGGLLLISVSGSTSVTLSRAGGGATPMTATLTRAASTSGGGIALLGTTLLPSGVQTYYIGGTLTVPANQPEGTYSGTFTLTVNYL